MGWTSFAASVFNTGKPGKGSIIEAIYDNITALANGDTGAPEIQTAAYAAQSVDTAALKDNNVTAAKLPDFTTGTKIIANSRDVALTSATTYTKTKEIYLPRAGTVSTAFQLRATAAADTVYARIYVNGSPVGTERSTSSSTYTSYTENISVSAGDLIQIYQKTSVGGDTSDVKEFKIKIGSPLTAAVIS